MKLRRGDTAEGGAGTRVQLGGGGSGQRIQQAADLHHGARPQRNELSAAQRSFQPAPTEELDEIGAAVRTVETGHGEGHVVHDATRQARSAALRRICGQTQADVDNLQSPPCATQ